MRYWEREQPQVLRTKKNELRFFPEHGKIQVYPRIEGTPHGVGRGVTINLEDEEPEVLMELASKFQETILNHTSILTDGGE